MTEQLNKRRTVTSMSRDKAIKEVHSLIQRSIKGDSKAFKKIYERFARELFLVCKRYMSNHQDAEEVLQEGFIKLYRDLYQFDSDKGSFLPWAKKIFINTALEHLRKKKLPKVELNGYHVVDNFEDEIFDKLGVLEILKLVTQLPVGYRTVINMFIIEGYSHQEIAEALSITESTSKSQLYKAKAKLRILLENNYPEYTNHHGRKAKSS